MKLKNLILIMVSITMLSCNSSDCNNGIQDGNEIGIDCGGNCPACPSFSSTMLALEGDWYWAYTLAYDSLYLYDNAYSNNSFCRVTLTLDAYQNNTQNNTDAWWCYGQVAGCNYPAEQVWTFNDINNVIGATWLVLEVTSDTLKINVIGIDFDYVYYKG